MASKNLSGITGTSSSGSSSSSSGGTNFAAGGEDALRALLAQLLGGGTPEQRAEAANRAIEVQAVRGQRGDYSKEAAFLDAQGAMSQQSRLALEKLIPSITRAAEGAGTSASSMRALLVQDSANKAAESASALGLKASVDYGNIASGLSSTLASLTQQNNPVTRALLDAIQLSKGQAGSVSESSGGGASTSFVNNNPNNLPMVNHSTWVNPFANMMTSNLPASSTPSMSSSGGWTNTSDSLSAAQQAYRDAVIEIENTSLGSSVAQGNTNIRNNKNSGASWSDAGWTF